MEYRHLVDRHDEAHRRVDLRFGHLLELVAQAAGVKRESGLPLRASDWFPSLREPPKVKAPDGRPAAIVLEDSVAEGWMGWARKAQEVAAARAGTG